MLHKISYNSYTYKVLTCYTRPNVNLTYLIQHLIYNIHSSFIQYSKQKTNDLIHLSINMYNINDVE